MPKVGIFSQRVKDRPNPIGVTTVEIISIGDDYIDVCGLDAIDATPVIDIKPYFPQYDKYVYKSTTCYLYKIIYQKEINMALVSPGVQVSITDESFFSSSGPGTVPLIMIATKQDKLTPDGSGIAPGTTAASRARLMPEDCPTRRARPPSRMFFRMLAIG